MVINITAIIYFVVTAIHKINFLIAIYINNFVTFVHIDSSIHNITHLKGR